nr:hemopexin fold protein [Tanacetum cinerariifolium]
NEYVVLNYAPGTTNARVVNGPRYIVNGFHSLVGTYFGEYGIDAAFGCHGGDDEAFIFSVEFCAKIKYAPGTTNDKILKGPDLIGEMFPFFKGTNFTANLDAAFESSVPNEVYIFKGGEYALVDYIQRKLIAIRPIVDGFNCLKNTIFDSDIGAAFASHNSQEAYMFKGNPYVLLHSTPGDTKDYIISGPKEIVPKNWPSLVNILPRYNVGVDMPEEMRAEHDRISSFVKKEDDLKEWGVKARMISRENTISRRFSSSYITSFREDACKSFRSNFTISSTASSPGYTQKEEIDPTTYSFTNALKALQLRSINTWEYLSPEGYALNSKWNEAERYICNPRSGEVPVECLSSKTLMSSRSFRNITNKMTLSAPLIHHSSRIQPLKLANIHPTQGENDTKENKFEDRLKIMMKQDVGIQNTLSDSSRSPVSTPSNQESSIKFSSNLDSSDASSKCESKSEMEIESEPKVELEFK